VSLAAVISLLIVEGFWLLQKTSTESPIQTEI